MKDVISVIVPVYNVSAYLPECLDSILSQDYEKLEVILIDDGSTDDSGAICDAYAQRDNRIRVIHQKNGGAAAAKNAGLRAATGEYLSFADSDDFLEPGAQGRPGRSCSRCTGLGGTGDAYPGQQQKARQQQANSLVQRFQKNFTPSPASRPFNPAMKRGPGSVLPW